MEGAFFFIFGVAVGMAILPHLQRMVEMARQRLAEFDQPKDPSSRR